jgi:hypothetical protein
MICFFQTHELETFQYVIALYVALLFIFLLGLYGTVNEKITVSILFSFLLISWIILYSSVTKNELKTVNFIIIILLTALSLLSIIYIFMIKCEQNLDFDQVLACDELFDDRIPISNNFSHFDHSEIDKPPPYSSIAVPPPYTISNTFVF